MKPGGLRRPRKEDDHDHGGPGVSFEFECEGEATQEISVTADGVAAQPILNKADLPTPNIDMEGPENAPIIIANRNGRQEGWINAAVGISGKYGTRGAAQDNWLVEGEGGAGDAGVGGYSMGIRIGADLKAAVRGGTSSLPAESAGNDAYCAVAVAMDDLGNMAFSPGYNRHGHVPHSA